jgi:hypothetical protein
MDIPWIYLMDIHGISKDIPCISRLLDIHGISKDIPCISMDIVEVYIYMVYTRHIPGIYRKSGFQMSPPVGCHCDGHPATSSSLSTSGT